MMSRQRTNIIDDLEARLDQAGDRAERFDLLIAAAERASQSNPARGLTLTVRARRLLKALGDPRRTVLCDQTAGDCEFVLGRYSKALELYERALEVARSVDYPEGAMRALQGIGNIQTTVGEYLAGLETLNEALRIAESIGATSYVAGTHNMIAIIFRHLGDHGRAIAEFHKSIAITESSGKRALSSTLNLGVEYLTFEDYDNARVLFERGIGLAIERGNRRSEGIATVNLGNVLHRLKEFDHAQSYYEQALEIFRELGDPLLEAYVLRSIGVLRRDMGMFNEALDVLRASYEISQRIGDATAFHTLTVIGEAHANMGDLTVAVGYSLRALEEARRQGDRDGELPIHGNLAEFYELMGELALALHHHKLYAALKEEVVGRDHQREMEQLRMRADIERAEREREAAESRARQLEAEMKQKTQELTVMALQMVGKNTFLEEIKQEMHDIAVDIDPSARLKLRVLVRKVESNLNTKEEWRAFEEKFELVHDGFLRKLAQEFPQLTRTELKICALVKLDLSNMEIADILKSSSRTVEWHRSNVRKKFALPADANLALHFTATRY